MRSGYRTIIQHVYEHGLVTSPRGDKTRECLDVIIDLADPTDSLPVDVGRAVNPAVGIVEAVQLIGALSVPDLMRTVQPRLADFFEPDGRQWGAYGERIGSQLLSVERKLMADPDSRQAVITLWDPWKDNALGKRDYPCTTMLQFLIRGGKLILHVTMRSNDVYWGLTYDVFQFTQLQLSLATALGLEPGHYHHHAVSLHIYERDELALSQITAPQVPRSAAPYLGVGRRGDDMEAIISRARDIALGRPLIEPTQSERRYVDALS